ncbi:MAG: hypothetical protein AAB605_01045 [Patescibacteria group bacterium]
MHIRIQEILLKVKLAGEGILAEWGLIVVIFLVAFGSFGLGRLSAVEKARPVVSIGQAPEEREPRSMAIGGLVVASRSGSVYHYPWCAGASQIAAANQVWFASEKAAQDAGYSPAKNCAGLAGSQ